MASFYEDHGPDFGYYHAAAPIKTNMLAKHLHPQYEVSLMLEPIQSTHTFNSEIVKLDTSFMAVFPPFCLHKTEFELDADADRMAFHFGEKMLQEYPNAFQCIEPYQKNQVIFFPLSSELTEQIRPLYKMFLTRTKKSVEQKCLFLLILNTVIHTVPPEAVICSSESENYISGVLQYMVHHCDEELTVEALSEKFFISKSKLASDFKQYTGITLHRMVNEIRISHAEFLLFYERWRSIQEIAESVGMGNGYHFYALFKKMRGVSPMQYYENKRGKPRTPS